MSPIDAIALNLHAQLALGRPLVQVLDDLDASAADPAAQQTRASTSTNQALRASALAAAQDAQDKAAEA